MGYNGAMLAIYFDLLLALEFQGEITIIKNDERFVSEDFDLGLKYKIIMMDECTDTVNSAFLICSNNPYGKYFLLNAFGKVFPCLENRLMTLVHPTSYIGGRAEINAGVIIEPGVFVSPFANLGKGVFLGRGVTIGHHNEIGEWATINPGATLTGKVKLGEYVTIGPGVTIITGISIGSRSIIGAGSVVTRDIPSGVIAYGNPCKVIRDNEKWQV